MGHWRPLPFRARRRAEPIDEWSTAGGPRLMGALICDYLRRRVRHLKVSFRHNHGANAKRADKNKECEIPGHRYSLLSARRMQRQSGQVCDRGHKTSFYLAPPKQTAMRQSRPKCCVAVNIETAISCRAPGSIRAVAPVAAGARQKAA